MTNLAILASHNGSGFDAIYQAVKDKKLDVNIKLVISNNSSSLALKKAIDYKIDNFLINANADEEIYKLLKKYKCNNIFLSGYMKKISLLLTSNFNIINSHPSLLPRHGGAGMYGRFVHESVINSKDKKSGVTIHKVDEIYDNGEILLQKETAISDDETPQSLEVKIKELEKLAIVEALKQCLK